MSPARKASRPLRARSRKPRTSRRVGRDSAAWIRALATPYLQGYKPVRVSDGSLDGFWFCTPPQRTSVRLVRSKSGMPPSRGQSSGFFVGYIESADAFSFLSLEPPECAVFVWVHPVAGTLHRRLVRPKGSLLRSTFEYIRWLTHRPPRFVFHDSELPAMARHQSMRGWPVPKRKHFSRNFFIETLAWLVRSGLVRKLKEKAS